MPALTDWFEISGILYSLGGEGRGYDFEVNLVLAKYSRLKQIPKHQRLKIFEGVNMNRIQAVNMRQSL